MLQFRFLKIESGNSTTFYTTRNYERYEQHGFSGRCLELPGAIGLEVSAARGYIRQFPTVT
jgi:hypothetical protein